jgi:uncharacterized protein YkwD
MAFRRSFVVLTLVAALTLAATGTAAAATPAGRTARTRMLQLVNASRRSHGLRPLQLNRRLSGSAWRHTRRMIRSGSLSHTATMRRTVRRFGAHSWGENVGVTTALLPAIERAFMASPEHRVNILSRRFEHVGIGVIALRGRRWVTVDFYG